MVFDASSLIYQIRLSHSHKDKSKGVCLSANKKHNKGIHAKTQTYILNRNRLFKQDASFVTLVKRDNFDFRNSLCSLVRRTILSRV